MIPRWEAADAVPTEAGRFVKHADHVALVKQVHATAKTWFESQVTVEVRKARDEEIVHAAIAWEDAEREVRAQSAKDERMAVERRIRESGVARHLPPHAWDALVKAVRGGHE